MTLVTVIIPYKEDRGWLDIAIKSVPTNCELILSKGNGNWPQNFNKALYNAKGDYIKYLHDDDFLTPNCIKDSLAAFKATGADFIHGNAYELHEMDGRIVKWIPLHKTPTITHMLQKNPIHSTTLMYKRGIFDLIGGFDESKEMYGLEEFEFNLRCLKAGFKIGYCDSFLATYRRHGRQCIRTIDKRMKNISKTKLVEKYRNWDLK